MSGPIDWNHCEARLSQACETAIRQFADEHADDEVSFLALHADYCYGHVTVAFDTVRNEAVQVADQVDRVNKSRAMQFDRNGGWRNALYYISRSSDRITDHTPSSGFFAYPGYCSIEFPEWLRYFRSDELSEEYGLQDRVIVLFWKVLDGLIRRHAFQPLRCGPVLRTGFEFHDSPLGLVVTHRVRRPNS